MTILAQTRDPFAAYETVDSAAKKPKPQIPEPGTYGVIFVALMIVLAMWMRRKR